MIRTVYNSGRQQTIHTRLTYPLRGLVLRDPCIHTLLFWACCSLWRLRQQQPAMRRSSTGSRLWRLQTRLCCSTRRSSHRTSFLNKFTPITTVSLTRVPPPCTVVVDIAPLDWRDVPLLTALSFGVQSVEADVWLINGTLFVRTDHEIRRIRDNDTLLGWPRECCLDSQ